jgi:hypothetical protein
MLCFICLSSMALLRAHTDSITQLWKFAVAPRVTLCHAPSPSPLLHMPWAQSCVAGWGVWRSPLHSHKFPHSHYFPHSYKSPYSHKFPHSHKLTQGYYFTILISSKTIEVFERKALDTFNWSITFDPGAEKGPTSEIDRCKPTFLNRTITSDS